MQQTAHSSLALMPQSAFRRIYPSNLHIELRCTLIGKQAEIDSVNRNVRERMEKLTIPRPVFPFTHSDERYMDGRHPFTV